MTSLVGVLGALPHLAVWVAGVTAGVRWRRHPVVSALVVTSACLDAFGAVAQAVMPLRLVERGSDLTRILVAWAAIGLIGSVSSVCLVAAVFIGRHDPRTSESPRAP